MSGKNKNKLTNLELRTLLENINESASQLKREFVIDRGTIYYYRKKLKKVNGSVELVLENQQKAWSYKQDDRIPRFTFKEKFNQDSKPQSYADFIAIEENKKNKRFEQLLNNHKKSTIFHIIY